MKETHESALSGGIVPAFAFPELSLNEAWMCCERRDSVFLKGFEGVGDANESKETHWEGNELQDGEDVA